MNIWQSFRDDHATATATLRTYRGALRLLRPHVIERDSVAAFDRIVTDNPLVRRFPQRERDRMAGEERATIENNRRAAGAVARRRAYDVRAIITRSRDAVARARRDVTLSMPDALDHVSADGMIALALLRLQLQAVLREASAPELHATYQAALERKDARGLVEAEIIEGLASSGAALAREDSERAASARLREYVAGVQDLRVPLDLPDVDALEADLNRLEARADALQLQPLNPEQHPAARQAFDELHDAMTVAGEKDDAEDQAALRAELAS
jgi:hypothetical protein